MFAALYVNGEPFGLSDENPNTIRLEFDTESAPTYRCRACGDDLTETTNGYESEFNGLHCPDYAPTDDTGPDYGEGMHDPERIPLSWCNSAGISTNEADDSITVSLSVGDPRGAFAFTITRIPDNANSDRAGRLILHAPYPGQPSPHKELTQIHAGVYVIGDLTRACIPRPAPDAV
ncbi:MAG: hypothetical protein JO272_03310 [Pseudonocardiales bacterium]|nr:hypothetical protein [Pseudonocardiales bacterium]